MKNKKLFAILTLVCFMFTLMPVAAFAADPYLTVEDEEKSYTADANETVTLKVENAAVEGYWFFMLDGEGDVVGRLPLNTTTDSTYELAVANYAGGSYDVYAVKADAQVTNVLNGASRYADKVDALFEDHAALVLDSVALKVRGAETTYNIALSGITGTDADGVDYINISANNGWTGGVVTATVYKNGTTPVKDAKLSFSTVGFVTATAIDAATDRSGQAMFKVAASKAGNYKVYVTYGDFTKVLNVNVTSANVANVTVVKAPTAPIALDSTITAAGVVFRFTDANGAAYNAGADRVLAAAGDNEGNYTLNIVSQPADSTLEATDFELDATTGALTARGGAQFEEEGDYTFKVTLQNGASASATVTVKEYDKTVGIEFDSDLAKTVQYDGTFTIAASDVVAVDANGVTKAATDDGSITFSVAGKAVQSFDGSDLVVKDEDYIGQKVTVYAVYKEAGKTFTATHEVTVIDTAAEIVYTATDAEVAVNNVLYANVVDAQGNKIILPAATTVQAIVLEKPATAIAVVDADWNDTYNRIDTDLLVSEAGEYTIQTIVTYTTGEPGSTTDWYLTSIDTITVGATEGEFKDVVVVSIGADKIIVNSDVVAIPAPAVIKDSRTFVPLRAVAEAFGAVVDYDQATGAVTAELNGVKVVMMNGDKAYTVNGVAKVADVAPYLNVEASSTMVPVSFIAKAFGINYQCIYAEDGTVADVLFTK